MRFQCPLCHKLVAVDDSEMGNQVQCGHCNEVVSVPPSRFASGSVIADFVIMKEIGRGGMGVVYLAHQISLDRPAALKILQDNYANNAEFVVNFIKEARLAAKLNHPHIVQAYAVGEDEGVFYFAMEYIDGETMKAVLRREKVLQIEQAVTLIQQVAEALDCAWKEQKLVHRDIKPDNIMLTKKNQAKLADLGLSQVAGEPDEDEDSDEVMGTPQYISPEQLTGAPVDVRSDIYSLGATFYQFVTGRFPYEGRSGTEIARKHLEAELVPPNQINPNVPEAVSQVICKMMMKNINDRYQDAESLVEDLRIIRRGKGTSGLTLPKAFNTQTGSVQRPNLASSAPSLQVPKLQLNPQAGTGSQSQPTPKIGVKSTIGLKRDGANVSQDTQASPAPGDTSSSPDSPTGGIRPLFADEKENPQTHTNNNLVLDPKGVEDLKDFKPRRKVVKITLLVVTLILLACGGGVGVLFYLQKESPEEAPPPDTTVAVDSYIKNIDEMMKIFSADPTKEKEFLNLVDSFLEKYPEPKTPEQQRKLKDLLTVYVPIDEKLRVIPARQQARSKHEDEIKVARELAEQQEAIRKQQQEEAARIKKEEEDRKRAQAEEQRKQQEQDKKYMAAMTAMKIKVPYQLTTMIQGNKLDDIDQLVVTANQEVDAFQTATPNVLAAAKALKTYLTTAIKDLKTGREYHTLLYNSGDTFQGKQVELRTNEARMLLRIVNIKNRVIHTVDSISNRTVNLNIDEMDEELLNLIIGRIERWQRITNMRFYIQLYTAEYLPAMNPADEFWTKELSAWQSNYFREKLKTLKGPELSEYRKKFGSLKTFPK